MSSQKPRLNFLWVGPPRSKLSTLPLGSDLKHVMEFANQAKNPISFYCLEEHKEEYKTILKNLGATKVLVKSIDAHMEKVADSKSPLNKQAKKMLTMRKELLSVPRNRIIDRVAFKDAFSLFLLGSKGGYTLDTNIQVKGSKKFELPKQKTFKFPIGFMDSPEVWLMYSKPTAPKTVIDMLDHYLAKWDEIQDIIRGKQKMPKNIYEYHRAITDLIVDSVQRGFRNNVKGAQSYEKSWRYKINRTAESTFASLPALPIMKQYGNTHKPWLEAQKIVEVKFKQYKKEVNKHTSKLTRLLESFIKKSAEGITQKKDIEELQIIINRALEFIKEIDNIKANFPTFKSDSTKTKSLTEKFSVEVENANSKIESFCNKIHAKLLKGELPNRTDIEKQQNLIDNTLAKLSKIVKSTSHHHKATAVSQKRFISFKTAFLKMPSIAAIKQDLLKLQKNVHQVEKDFKKGSKIYEALNTICNRVDSAGKVYINNLNKSGNTAKKRHAYRDEFVEKAIDAINSVKTIIIQYDDPEPKKVLQRITNFLSGAKINFKSDIASQYKKCKTSQKMSRLDNELSKQLLLDEKSMKKAAEFK
jgi:hypothetical protein